MAVDLKEIRRARLTQLANLKSVEIPSGLAALIKKERNQVYNLLHGTSSFGEKVARSIEEAAGLPTLWLDIDQEAGDRLPGWPFDPALLDRLVALDDRDRLIIQGRLEEAIASREKSSVANRDDLSELPLQGTELGRTTAGPALKVRPNVERVLLKEQRAAGSKSGEVQKSRAGRGSKGTPRRG